jgi:hypothetical protein
VAQSGGEGLEAIVDCLPTLDSPPGFVLCPPDFDSQSVPVDDEGTVTRFIDWDLAQTMPRFVGYATYPGCMVGPRWPNRRTLQRHWDDKSHMAETIWIAALHRLNRLEVCRKFVQVAAGDDVESLDVLYDIGAEHYRE